MVELFLNICLILQGVYAEGARWYSGEPGGGQLQDHSGRCIQVVENLQVDFTKKFDFNNSCHLFCLLHSPFSTFVHSPFRQFEKKVYFYETL